MQQGCAQEYFGIKPDLTTMGKVIGGGLPVGAYGGRKDIMSMISPSGPVYQAGTLSGNPLAMTAGIKTLEILARPGAYEHLQKVTKMLIDGMLAAGKEAGHDMCGSNISGGCPGKLRQGWAYQLCRVPGFAPGVRREHSLWA